MKSIINIVSPYILILLGIIVISCNKGGTDSEGPQVEIKSGTTDSRGQASFADNSASEDVIIEVIDSEDKSPLGNIQVTYYDGNEYEVFLVVDTSNEYLPSIGLFAHNSEHVIEMGKYENGIYEIYTIDAENLLAQVIWRWKSDNNMDFSTYNYERTIDYDEYIDISDRKAVSVDFLWEVMLYIFGAQSPISPSQFVEICCPEAENPPQRYDIYMYRMGSDQYSSLSMIPSNIPTVNINTLNIDNNEVTVIWEGVDTDIYEDGIVFLPDNKDLTIYLDGNSTSDLTYSYRITKNEVVYNGYDWTAYGVAVSTTASIADRGTYTFEVRVKDEVDNIGETASDFIIQENSEDLCTVTDIDDNVYQTVTIGTQVWMAENLKVTRYRNGDTIPNTINNSTWAGLTTGAYCEYDNDSTNVPTYGRLYNWYACVDVRNIAPEGWHVPTDEEWKQMEMDIGMSQSEADTVRGRGTDEGGKLKEADTTHWSSPNTGATNESGFSALPGGYRDGYGYFLSIDINATFWSTPEFSSTNAWYRSLSYYNSEIYRYHYVKPYGFSVRCVRD